MADETMFSVLVSYPAEVKRWLELVGEGEAEEAGRVIKALLLGLLPDELLLALGRNWEGVMRIVGLAFVTGYLHALKDNALYSGFLELFKVMDEQNKPV